MKTFLPRTGAKPPTQEYNQDNNNITPFSTLITTDPYLFLSTQSKYIISTYQQPHIITQPPQIITPHPVIISEQQPMNNYYQKPINLLRESNRSHISGYSNPTYRAYLNST